MLGRFFSTKQIDSQGANHAQITLLSGPPSCGKTSLLFQFAINSAQENKKGNVVFICNKRRLESNPPFLSQDIDAGSNVFQRIQMNPAASTLEEYVLVEYSCSRYLEDDEGIKKYFAAFHLHDTFPTTIIIDDFGDFFNDKKCQERYGNARGRDLAIVRALALCQDAINHATERLHSQGHCKLLLSDTHHGENPRLLFIYKRWIHQIFIIRGDGSGSYLLKGSSFGIGSNTGIGLKRTAKYSTALQYLVLEELIVE